MPGRGHPRLVSVPLVEPTVERTLGIVQRHGRTLSPAAEALYQLVKRARATTSSRTRRGGAR
jgi:hypothetical protein